MVPHTHPPPGQQPAVVVEMKMAPIHTIHTIHTIHPHHPPGQQPAVVVEMKMAPIHTSFRSSVLSAIARPLLRCYRLLLFLLLLAAPIFTSFSYSSLLFRTLLPFLIPPPSLNRYSKVNFYVEGRFKR